MAFDHVTPATRPHKHETVAEARLCERGRETITTIRTDDDVIREARHQDPCVCGPYDMCWEFRVAGQRHSGRDRFRSYCD